MKKMIMTLGLVAACSFTTVGCAGKQQVDNSALEACQASEAQARADLEAAQQKLAALELGPGLALRAALYGRTSNEPGSGDVGLNTRVASASVSQQRCDMPGALALRPTPAPNGHPATVAQLEHLFFYFEIKPFGHSLPSGSSPCTNCRCKRVDTIQLYYTISI